jgi:hypothetical protein
MGARQSGANFGPLSPGDLYDLTLGRKAIVVKKGKYLKCDFKLRMLTEPLFFQGIDITLGPYDGDPPEGYKPVQ